MTTSNIFSVSNLLEMPVISRLSGNKLGVIEDILVDPLEGSLRGLIVKSNEETNSIIDYKDIYCVGPDAVMVDDESVASSLDQSKIGKIAQCKKDLLGTKIITEGGKLLGRVGNIFIHLSNPLAVIYEVRDSVLDKLLGRGLFMLASAACALSEDSERIIVSNDASEKAAGSVERLIEYLSTYTKEGLTTKHVSKEVLGSERYGTARSY
jgi:sporulation protein YlmC with PRC-barrel domain